MRVQALFFVLASGLPVVVIVFQVHYHRIPDLRFSAIIVTGNMSLAFDDRDVHKEKVLVAVMPLVASRVVSSEDPP